MIQLIPNRQDTQDTQLFTQARYYGYKYGFSGYRNLPYCL